MLMTKEVKLRYRSLSHRGYTLIELLVALSIIVALLSVSLAGVASVRVRSRDAKRIADLQTIQSALEQHAVNDPSHTYPPETLSDARNNQYCVAPGETVDDFGIYNNECFSIYLPVTPVDPKGKPYSYFKPACLPSGGEMKHGTIKAECVGGTFASFGLHADLESDKNQSGTTDASPTDPKSYDLIP